MRALLDGVVSQTADAEEYLILDQTGLVRLSTTPTHEGASQAHERYFQDASSGITTVEPARLSTLTKQPAITIATPLFNQDGQEIGELAAALNLERLDSIVLQSTGLGESGQIYLVGSNNRFVGKRLATGPYGGSVHSSGIDAGLRQVRGHALYADYRGQAVIGAYHWLPGTGTALIAEMNQAAAFAPARTLGLTIGGFGLLVVALLGLGTYVASRRIARPILAITDTAEAVAAGDLDREAPVTTNDEVGKLAVAFNAMTRRLRETLEGLELRVAERTDELAKQNVELEALNETSVGIMQRLELDELLARADRTAPGDARHAARLRLPGAPARGARRIASPPACSRPTSDAGRAAVTGCRGTRLGSRRADRRRRLRPLGRPRYHHRRGRDRRARRRSAALGRRRPSARSAWRAPTDGRALVLRTRSTCFSGSPSSPRSRSTTPGCSPTPRTPARRRTTRTRRRASSSRR